MDRLGWVQVGPAGGEIEQIGGGLLLRGLAGPGQREQVGRAEGVCLSLGSGSCLRVDHVLEFSCCHRQPPCRQRTDEVRCSVKDLPPTGAWFRGSLRSHLNHRRGRGLGVAFAPQPATASVRSHLNHRAGGTVSTPHCPSGRVGCVVLQPTREERTMFAIIGSWPVEGVLDAAALEHIAANVSQQPGFVRGLWGQAPASGRRGARGGGPPGRGERPVHGGRDHGCDPVGVRAGRAGAGRGLGRPRRRQCATPYNRSPASPRPGTM